MLFTKTSTFRLIKGDDIVYHRLIIFLSKFKQEFLYSSACYRVEKPRKWVSIFHQTGLLHDAYSLLSHNILSQ